MTRNISSAQLSKVRSIEAHLRFPDGTIHYLVHWESDDPLTFTWHPATCFSGHPALIHRYWLEKVSRLKSIATQTDFRLFIRQFPPPPLIDDPFEDFQPPHSPSLTSNLSDGALIHRILSYSRDSHSFVVQIADHPDELEIPEKVLLTLSPALVADFFLNEN